MTVPAGKRWVLKDLESYNTGAAGLGFWHVAGVYLLKQASSSSDETYSFNELSIVLEAGDTLAFTVSSGSWYWHASGYELDAP